MICQFEIKQVEKKTDVNKGNFKNNTHLHYFLQNEKISREILDFLIEKKSFLNHLNLEDDTPFAVACKHQNFENLKFLIGFFFSEQLKVETLIVLNYF